MTGGCPVRRGINTWRGDDYPEFDAFLDEIRHDLISSGLLDPEGGPDHDTLPDGDDDFIFPTVDVSDESEDGIDSLNFGQDRDDSRSGD